MFSTVTHYYVQMNEYPDLKAGHRTIKHTPTEHHLKIIKLLLPFYPKFSPPLLFIQFP